MALLTLPDPAKLSDEHGRRLIPINVGSTALAWKAEDGSRIAMPFLFPRFYNDVEIAPVMVWGNGKNQHVLEGWQVWLINPKTGETITKFEHPFVTLTPYEGLFFDQSSGQIEVVKRSGDTSVPTVRVVGVQLAKPAPPIATIDGLAFYGNFSQIDINAFKEMVSLLKTKTPQWWKYVASSEPLVVVFDPTLEGIWTGFCCDAEGRGRITVPNHFSKPSAADSLLSAAVLIHEVTHVRDGRSLKLRIHLPRTKEDCQYNENSAVKQQIAYLNDLLSVMPASEILAQKTRIFPPRIFANLR
ncbi:MAG: hypothetical protein HY741_21395 [Chloroflexi bacterium]|nr:hypothetical protein [Chloroflexota bacterium]